MSLVVSSSGDFPHKSGPIQCSCPHFLVAAAMVRWSSLWAACFLIAKRALGPQIALLRDCSPFTVHRKRIRSVLSFHSFVSCRLPYSALSSALSFRGSPRCAFTLTRKVAAPASTLRLSASMISFSMSAFTLSASVARWPSPIHFRSSVISIWQSSSANRSRCGSALSISWRRAASSALRELVPSSSLPTLDHPCGFLSLGL